MKVATPIVMLRSAAAAEGGETEVVLVGSAADVLAKPMGTELVLSPSPLLIAVRATL